MKKLFITALVAVSVSLSVNAQDVTNVKAVNNFAATFSDVSNVQWVSEETFTKAFFTQNEKNMQAYYDVDGDFIATTTVIDKDELPVSVRTSFKKKYAGYNIKQAFELTSDDETAYFITAEKDTDKIIVKVKGTWFSVYSKL